MQIVVINKQHHRACMGNMQHGSGQTVNGKRYKIHCEISIKHFPSPPSHFHHSPFATLCTVHQKSIKTGILHFVCCHINLSLSLAQLAVLFFCCTLLVADAAEPETKPADAKAEPAVTTTKLTPSVEEPKSKTEKRDSSDQTGECEAVDTLFFVYHLCCCSCSTRIGVCDQTRQGDALQIQLRIPGHGTNSFGGCCCCCLSRGGRK